MATVSMTDKQKVLVTAQALDATGAQVNFTAPPAFILSDLTLANIVPLAATDPQPPAGQVAMWLVALKDGAGTLSVSEDAVLGDDATKITGSLSFTIIAPVVVAASIAVSGAAAVAQP